MAAAASSAQKGPAAPAFLFLLLALLASWPGEAGARRQRQLPAPSLTCAESGAGDCRTVDRLGSETEVASYGLRAPDAGLLQAAERRFSYASAGELAALQPGAGSRLVSPAARNAPLPPPPTTTTSSSLIKVPERAAIIVSSSDNSYVSASPIQEAPQPARARTRPTHLPLPVPLPWRHSSAMSNIDSNLDARPAQSPEWPAAAAADDGDDEPDADAYNVSARFKTQPATIIKTRESLALGAVFINYTLVTSLKACLVECWLTDSCDTAIYQESPVEFVSGSSPAHSRHLPLLASRAAARDESALATGRAPGAEPDSGPSKPAGDNTYLVCYLFQCANRDGFECQFSAHNYYVSATLRSASGAAALGSAAVEPPAPAARVQQSSPAPPDAVSFTVQQAPEAASPASLIGGGALVMEQQRPHLANIHIGRENDDLDGQLGRYRKRRLAPGSLNSALIALVMGVGATCLLLLIVGRRMDSIRRRAADQRRTTARRKSCPLAAAAAAAAAMVEAAEKADALVRDQRLRQDQRPELSLVRDQVNGNQAKDRLLPAQPDSPQVTGHWWRRWSGSGSRASEEGRRSATSLSRYSFYIRSLREASNFLLANKLHQLPAV